LSVQRDGRSSRSSLPAWKEKQPKVLCACHHATVRDSALVCILLLETVHRQSSTANALLKRVRRAQDGCDPSKSISIRGWKKRIGGHLSSTFVATRLILRSRSPAGAARALSIQTASASTI
jgi:hypothetical protein